MWIPMVEEQSEPCQVLHKSVTQRTCGPEVRQDGAVLNQHPSPIMVWGRGGAVGMALMNNYKNKGRSRASQTR